MKEAPTVDRDEALETIRRAKTTEEDEYQLWRTEKSQGVQGPRFEQTVGEPDQSQQPPVQPICSTASTKLMMTGCDCS